MHKSLQAVIEKRIERTVKALCANHYDAHYLSGIPQLHEKLAEYVSAGSTCTVGGSMTLFETGVIDYLKGCGCTYYDRYAESADINDIYRKAFSCDVYFASANAVTEDGYLFNVDGRGNRVAAMVYGPQKVVVVAGYNKIVKDLDAARARIREIAAPANCVRLNLGNPCAKTGYCMDCKSDTYICGNELVLKLQTQKDRITVLILPDSYGF